MIKICLRQFAKFHKSSYKFEDSYTTIFKDEKIQQLLADIYNLSFIYPICSIYTFGFTTDSILMAAKSTFVYYFFTSVCAIRTMRTVDEIKISDDGRKVKIRTIFPIQYFELNISEITLNKPLDKQKYALFGLYKFKTPDAILKILKTGEILDEALLMSVLNGER